MHRRPNTMERVDDDEIKLGEAHKHTFGIFKIWLSTGFGMMLAIILAYLLLPSVFGDDEQAFVVGSYFAVFAVIISGIIILVSTYIYRQSRIVITDRNITQILQYGLFNRKVSQLNVVNIEDVTSVQHGLLATIMNYGTLKIETAGEQANFNFTYCPNSSYYAKIILDAREKMLGQMDNSLDGTKLDVSKGKHNTNKKKTGSHKSKSAKVKGLGAEVVEHALDDSNK